MRFSNPRPIYAELGSNRFARWVRDLDGLSGVYIIYVEDVPEYVGSSIRNLYGTITRHVQTWNRFEGKGFTGYVWDRVDIAVSVLITADDDARDVELATIADLAPRLNAGSEVSDGRNVFDELDDAVDEVLDEIPF